MNTHGGFREGAGRPAGSTNLATTEQRKNVAELARAYSEEAINTLIDLMRTAEKESTRLAAAAALLDRAYGKPTHFIEQSSHMTHEEELEYLK